MSTSQDLRELSRQSRIRLAAAGVMRTEHRLLSAQCRRRLDESRALLDRAAARRPQRDSESTEDAPSNDRSSPGRPASEPPALHGTS